ncbi:hypothetical protein QUF63_10940, partial [Anaerolineales bacterium HSG25]|nr:hypothetical protein [Anaerolineales bacterium HSG25]
MLKIKHILKTNQLYIMGRLLLALIPVLLGIRIMQKNKLPQSQTSKWINQGLTKKMRLLFITTVITIFAFGLIHQAEPIYADGPTFSTDSKDEDPTSGASTTPNGDDLYNPGVGGNPVTTPPIDLVGTTGAPTINVDGFSFGYGAGEISFVSEYLFSVDRSSVGNNGTTVYLEATPFEAGSTASDVGQAGDIYMSIGTVTNTHAYDDDGTTNSANGQNNSGSSNGVSALGLLNNGDGTVGNQDGSPGGAWESHNVDGFDSRDKDDAGLTTIFFSVDTVSAASYGAGSGANIYSAIYVSDYDASTPNIYALATDLGLVAADDIDALVVFDDGDLVYDSGDTVLFSLASGSTSLGGLGATADDILSVTSGGLPSVYVDGTLLGLAGGGTDELNALDVTVTVAQIVSTGTTYDSLQTAIDAATGGDTIKVIGGLIPDSPVVRAGLTQTGYITKALTIEGGYNSAFSISDADNCTTLNAGNTGRAMVISGTVEGELICMQLTGGDASAGGNGTSFDNRGGGLAV